MRQSTALIRTEHFPFKTCGNSSCPLCTRGNALFKVKPFLNKEEFESSSPAPFVGHYGYPKINVGVLSPSLPHDEIWKFDAPQQWARDNESIAQIVTYRSSLINSNFKMHIKQQNKLLELSQDIGLAAKPVDIAVKLKRLPAFRWSFDSHTAPVGPRAELKKAEATSNPKIPRHVDKVFSDTDLKAAQALQYLYKHNFDENYLSRMLSVGTMGIGKNRKIVPTRWSITATDDTLGKQLIKTIKDYSRFTEYSCWFGGYLGNYFLVLSLPEVWGYELFETLVPDNASAKSILSFITDAEQYTGRKCYAQETAGGYYASRLAVVEKLAQEKRQGRMIAIRFITSEYTVPLGVWVVREAIRKSLQSKPLHFSSLSLLLQYANDFVKNKFTINPKQFLDKSVLLKELRKQSKLSDFM